jgi:hypothetical protein
LNNSMFKKILLRLLAKMQKNREKNINDIESFNIVVKDLHLL